MMIHNNLAFFVDHGVILQLAGSIEDNAAKMDVKKCNNEWLPSPTSQFLRNISVLQE